MSMFITMSFTIIALHYNIFFVLVCQSKQQGFYYIEMSDYLIVC